MIAKLFHEDAKTLQEGENAYTSNHVKFMRYIGDIRSAVLEGQIRARMKKTIELDMDSHTIVNHHCSCPRDLDLCHHMAALLYYGHYNISVVNRPNVSTETKSCIANQCCGDDNIVLIRFSGVIVRPSVEYIEEDDKQLYVSSQCALSVDQIRNIATATFGLILGAYKRNIETGRNFPKSLFTSLVEGYSLSKVMAVQWGRNNERAATKQFEELHMLKVNQTGLWLDTSGFLVASPDFGS
nr:unnamed protein product [Callosobruchus analis]